MNILIFYVPLNAVYFIHFPFFIIVGVIQLKNWKPLTFDQITESPEATVGDILGELSTVATLRIRLYR